ncbi:hypothetical protein RIF29_08216 [Crotalaria pallida]|uniref:Uncharacterized protein n=1 Tax=Crotalaria pallida TaxID=3830 RepID=A0AAN9J6A4_CROPI
MNSSDSGMEDNQAQAQAHYKAEDYFHSPMALFSKSSLKRRRSLSSDSYHFFKHPNIQHSPPNSPPHKPEDEEADAELMRKSKEAEDRLNLLSMNFEGESIFPNDMPTLIQRIKNLVEEKMSLALEVSTNLRKEKNEMQSALEKELNRRSTDWSSNHERHQLEQKRLLERVRVLAEQNVLLQREISSISKREIESVTAMTYANQQLKESTEKADEMKAENLLLRQNLLELQQKYKIAEENRDCIPRNFEENEKECKELHKPLTRILKTCSEQEKTITGLQDGFSEDFQKNQSMERIDKLVAKLRI